MIYTSYYANHKKYSNFYRISISRKTPENAADICLRFLAPDSSLLYDYKNGSIGEEEYARRYLSSLEELHNNGTLDNFVHYLLNHPMDVVLLCYESPCKFCHRHLLADYLNQQYGLEIKEL